MRSIVSTPDTCSGAPRIDDTRLTCGNIVSILSTISVSEFLEVYDYITILDIKNALNYCVKKHCITNNVSYFCHLCSLNEDKDVEFPDVFITSEKELEAYLSSPEGQAYLGSENDYIEQLRGTDYWIDAERLLSLIT